MNIFEYYKKISSELIYIGYNPTHIGTQYIKECILELEQIKCNFICLNSSYMAITGYDKIVNICKKILD